MLKRILISMIQLMLLCLLVLWLMLSSCKEGFLVINGKPTIVNITGAGKKSHPVLGADPQTFKSLDNAEDADVIYAVDAKSVFMGMGSRSMKIKSADPASFTILTNKGAYSSDSERVYWYGIELQEADPDSFKVLIAPYAIDANRVFVGSRPLEVHSVSNFEVLEVYGVDVPIRVVSIEVAIDLDEEHVSGWSRDGVAYYWGSIELAGANYNSIVLLNDTHAKDESKVFYCGQLIRGADAESFVVVGPGSISGRDKNYMYKQGKRTGRVEKDDENP